ncbi:hypothetical protein FTX61_01605 [Nitriliruptoraceae bacterium ZYF776]|nr:hypothetical protein [Profundirhabdus halotolerans]
MKYMLLAYTNAAEWGQVDTSSPEFLEMCAFYEDLGAELAASGELVSTEGLADPALTRTVRAPGGGAPVVSDGPYAEAKEVLVSFSILDVEDLERALELAGRVAAATGDTIEVRPIMEDDPREVGAEASMP